MYLSKSGLNLRRNRRNSPMRIAIYVIVIMAGLYVLNLDRQGVIDKPFLPTSTATRSPNSYAEEAKEQFSLGRLDNAVQAYQKAIELESTRIDYWIQLTRVQVYADKPKDAVKSAQTAILIDPKNSMAHAVHALALDWNGDYAAASDAAVRAIQLDPNNALAHAYYAEILTDSQRWAQAGDEARLALSLDPNSMDAYRTFGYYMESTGNYRQAIQAYQSAIKINPNLGFLYKQTGVNFRQLKEYDIAIQYFQRAQAINPNDIETYILISRTYFQTGEYGRAAQYLESALELQPGNARLHGQLGMVYFKALNYEGAIEELACAVDGCDWETEKKLKVKVPGLPLEKGNLEFFYTYSSVLSALSTPEKPYCKRSLPLMEQIKAFAPDDKIVAGIVQENINICAIAANATPKPIGTPTRAPLNQTPVATVTAAKPTPTFTPTRRP